MFVTEVFTGVFGLLTQVLQTTPATLSHKQLSEVCSLLHEFHNRDGFTVFSMLLHSISAYCDDIKPNSSSSKRTSSPMSSPGKSSAVTTSGGAYGAKSGTCILLFTSLLSSYEKLITMIQKLKVEYLHKVGCSRLTHKSCDLSKLVPVHHDLLGDEPVQASLNKEKKTPQPVPSPSTKKLSEHLRKISLTSFR